jgi:hypothetical protein
MSDGTYYSDPEKQKRAKEAIDQAFRHGDWTLEELFRRHLQNANWMGYDDDFAQQMRNAGHFEGVTDALKQVLQGLRGAWTRAEQLGVEAERPRDRALEEIRRLPSSRKG